MIPESVIQLGLAATILFIVLLIMGVTAQIIKAVLTTNSTNDKDNSEITKSLLSLLTGLSSAINTNSGVLAKLETYISSEKNGTKEALNVLESRIVEHFGILRKANKDDIGEVLKIVREVQRSLDDTIQIPDDIGGMDD
jgi:hypothetical protein